MHQVNRTYRWTRSTLLMKYSDANCITPIVVIKLASRYVIIAMYWLEVTAPLLNRDRQFLLPEVWGQKIINRLHKIVHAQWVYRNALIHYKDRDGFTSLEQQEIFNKVEEFALRDPDTLLPHHRCLFQADFKTLGSGHTSDRLFWLANMNTAIATSDLARAGTLNPEATAYFSVANPSRTYNR